MTVLPWKVDLAVWTTGIIYGISESRQNPRDVPADWKEDREQYVEIKIAATPEMVRWLIDYCFNGKEIAVAFMPKPEAA
jgi:hypothetical protein